MNDGISQKTDYYWIIKIFNWFKNNHFNIIFALIFGVGGYLLWSNTKPQEPRAIRKLITAIKENTKAVTMLQQKADNPNNVEEKKYKTNIPNRTNTSVEYTVMNDTEISKTENAPKFYTIRLDDFENALKAVALTSRQEAAEDYHKSFSIFVAMLSLFGIGFPIIIALIQSRINEKELDKVVEATNNAQNALIDINEAFSKYKSEILETNIILYRDIKTLFATLSDVYIKQINEGCNNLFELLVSKGKVYYIMEAEALLRKMKQYQDWNQFRTQLATITTQTNILSQIIDHLKNDSQEILPYNTARTHLSDCLKEYRSFLVKIKNIVPEDFHNDIDHLQNIIQDAINKSNQN